MSNEIYEHECTACERTTRINSPGDPEWCPYCGVKQ